MRRPRRKGDPMPDGPYRAARVAAGLTVAQAARAVGVSDGYLRAIEGHGGASYGLAVALARLYRVNATSFIFGTASACTELPRA